MAPRPVTKLLELHANNIDEARKEINLAKPGEMEGAIKIISDWIQLQPHFKKKDFSDNYIEAVIMTSKGSLERAKGIIDKACTMRTLWPNFFDIKDIRKDLAEILELGSLAVLPKLTSENHRIVYNKIEKSITNASYMLQHYKLGCCVAEYVRKHDVISCYQYIFDMRQANMTDFLTSFNLMDFRQACSIFLDCYSLRIKGIHIVSNSKIVETFVGILKQILKPKLVSRVHVHTDCEDLVKLFGDECLPADLGGTLKPAKEIQGAWIEALTSKENFEYLRNINDGGTDEQLRPAVQFNQEYAGMPGSFRLLSVD